MDWDALTFEEKVSLFKRALSYCTNQMENFSIRIKDNIFLKSIFGQEKHPKTSGAWNASFRK
jgi:hypothetical protein